MRSLAERLRVYLVADPDMVEGDLAPLVEAALTGGVTAVQLRAKTMTDREALTLARRIAPLCREHEALFLVNDRVDLALAANADGVHLGVDDLPLVDARRLLGADRVIGYSPETDEQSTGAAADYLGVGPVFGTASKSDAGPAIGLDTLMRRARLARVPVIGIGGITPANAAKVIEAGATGVAVMSAILRAPDPAAVASSLSVAIAAAPA